MLPDRVSNPGPLTYESDALPIALRGLAFASAVFELLLRHDFDQIKTLTLGVGTYLLCGTHCLIMLYLSVKFP